MLNKYPLWLKRGIIGAIIPIVVLIINLIFDKIVGLSGEGSLFVFLIISLPTLPIFFLFDRPYSSYELAFTMHLISTIIFYFCFGAFIGVLIKPIIKLFKNIKKILKKSTTKIKKSLVKFAQYYRGLKLWILFFLIIIGLITLPFFCKCERAHMTKMVGDECHYLVESFSYFFYKLLYFLPHKILIGYTDMCFRIPLSFWILTFIYWNLLSIVAEFIWKKSLACKSAGFIE